MGFSLVRQNSCPHCVTTARNRAALHSVVHAADLPPREHLLSSCTVRVFYYSAESSQDLIRGQLKVVSDMILFPVHAAMEVGECRQMRSSEARNDGMPCQGLLPSRPVSS